MLSPRDQSGLQAEILASVSASKLRPRPWLQTFGLCLASVSRSAAEDPAAKKSSDVVLESGSVLESDSSTYFEDSDSDSDSSPRTRLDSRFSGIGLSTV